MAARGIILVTLALFVGIAALVLHVLAICSPTWKVSKRIVQPILTPVNYGIWERCEYTNVSVLRQGIASGQRVDVQYCFPNHYMRYSPEFFTQCHPRRRECHITDKHAVPVECQCRYLPSTKALQWLTVIAAGFLFLGLILLYLRAISSPTNNSAAVLLGYGPFLFFLLALLLMAAGLIIYGVRFRQDIYENNSFPVSALRDRPSETYNIYSLQIHAKSTNASLSSEEYGEAEKTLRVDIYSHYRTIPGRAAIYEIIATVLVLFVTALAFWLSTLNAVEDKI